MRFLFFNSLFLSFPKSSIGDSGSLLFEPNASIDSCYIKLFIKTNKTSSFTREFGAIDLRQHFRASWRKCFKVPFRNCFRSRSSWILLTARLFYSGWHNVPLSFTRAPRSSCCCREEFLWVWATSSSLKIQSSFSILQLFSELSKWYPYSADQLQGLYKEMLFLFFTPVLVFPVVSEGTI